MTGQDLALGADPPLDETRLSIHTLVREDIFAGWRSQNMERFERGAKNVDVLLKKRPNDRADLLAWKGAVLLFRAVLAHEAGDEQEFQIQFADARDMFRKSKESNANNAGAIAVIGGSYFVFADRLPEGVRKTAWDACYDNYQALYRLQKGTLDRLPTHMRGELLAGLAQASQRTGRTAELKGHLDKILELLPKTGYSRTATLWKTNPELAKSGSIGCKSCHSPGRLSSQLSRLEER